MRMILGNTLKEIGFEVSEAGHGQEANLAQRRAAVPAVAQIVEEAVAEWETWLAARPVESLIKSLYQAATSASRRAAEHWGGLDEAARFDTEQ